MELVSHVVPPPLPPHQHIWTFATGLDEQTQYGSCCTCPCVAGSTAGSNIPSFMGQNYFCKSGITRWDGRSIFWPYSDPLWNGQGCGPTSSCCTFNSLSTHHHGSTYNYPPLQPMALRSGYATQMETMKILQYNLWNSIKLIPHA